MRRLVLGFVAALLLPWPVLACLNDRDTESIEAGRLPDVLAVITGQFDRNPPQYYQMRLRRVAEAIEVTPVSLPLYDDAAVACDRLGRFDEAIGWMEKKRGLLERSDDGSPAVREQWYRYYANLGTHWAHRWLKNGADRTRIDEMRTARDLIAKAIEIKPNAHFGRERFQLLTLDWIIDPPMVGHRDQALPTIIIPNRGNPAAEAVQGLCGLIVLGNAWESVDIFHTLAVSLHLLGDHDLAYQADLRAAELVDSGRGSMVPGAPRGDELKGILLRTQPPVVRPSNVGRLTNDFLELRDKAEVHHRERSDFLLARLREGRHPDTDASFWVGGEQFNLALTGEDREPIAVLPPVLPGLSRPVVEVRPLSLLLGNIGFLVAGMAILLAIAIITGRFLLALLGSRRERKPLPVDADWL